MRRVLKTLFSQKSPSCSFIMIFLLRLLLFFNGFITDIYYTHFINGRENSETREEEPSFLEVWQNRFL